MTETNTQLKRTPLFDWHLAHDGQMVDFAGWEMPVQYPSGVIQEHLGTRKSGGLFDVSHMGRFRIKGPDKLDFLQKALTNNALALKPWEAQYTILANEQGGALDDAFLYRFDQQDYLLVVNASNRDKDWAHFQEVLSGFKGVTLEDCTESLSLIALQGPKTRELLEKVAGSGLWPEARQNSLGRVRICGVDCYLSRTGYTGEPNSFEIFPPADQALALWEGLLSAGRNFGVLPVGLGARDTLRLEAGMPLYGHELGMGPDGKEIPIFALPLATVAVSLSPLKGDFIGRQALAAQWRALERQRDGDFSESEVLPKRIKCLALEDKGVARQGAEVFYDQEKVGDVTSGTSVPYWVFAGEGLEMRPTGEQSRRSIGLAYLQAWIQPETKVRVKVRNRMIQARVVAYHGRSEAPPYFHPLPAGYARPAPETPEGRALGRLRTVLGKSWENHAWRQGLTINLIPSEMTPSPLVRLTQVADPVGRYAEHKDLAAAYDQEIFYYQGCDFIAWVEEQLAGEMGRFLGCPLVECRPVSGQMANMTVFSGLVQWRNRANLKREPGRISLAFTNHIGKGGHLSAQPMGALRDYIAKDPVTEKFSVVNFPVLPDNPYRIDLEALEGLLDEYDPELIVFGKSMVLHQEPVAQVRAMLEDRRKKAIIMYDMAHVLGLIGPHFQEPFAEGADIVTGSTHKTFFGSQRGVIGCRFDQENTPEHELWQAVRKRSFPGMVSNHHLGTLLGLLVASIEMNAFKDSYQPRVIANAKAFARALKDCGLDVQGDPGIDYTETHQVVVKVGYTRGPDVAKTLEENQIICNYQALPEDEGFTASSGLRLGVSEMTRFGMQEKDFEALAQLMADCILKNQDVTEAVTRLRKDFQELGYCFGEDQVQPFKERFLQTLR
ncbi:MAG: glycine cleavage system aminomethyltransferase GcvT [Desulfohalobiaceae bacterium]|nr:glycine cleavage system aminomethyltransferase GcvT [Desulfohalobiaceae bacterium]